MLIFLFEWNMLLCHSSSLEGAAGLSSKEKNIINELALCWDLPPITSANRKWLFEELLLHAVSILLRT
uniref:Uncharacterized protein n=1 Tax=Cyclopterus lumpus TaxID=8103 RepID=A0A8C2ZTB7_CYCLU